MLIFCPNCNASLSDRFLRQAHATGNCYTCGTTLTFSVFPALFRPQAKIDSQSLQSVEGEGSCYEHPGKRAVTLCHKCGRFLCALCEVQVDGNVWCPSCLTPAAGGKVEALENQRTLYDSIALALVTWPLLIFYFVFLTAPAAIFIAIRYWKRPSSIVPRSKWRSWFVVIFGIAQLVGVVLFIIAIFTVQSKVPGQK